MSAIPSIDSVHSLIDSMFCPKRKQRALDWAATTEGRETLAGQYEEMKSTSKPVNPTGG